MDMGHCLGGFGVLYEHLLTKLEQLLKTSLHLNSLNPSAMDSHY